MFRNIETNEIITEKELKERFPNTLFGEPILNSHVNPLGYETYVPPVEEPVERVPTIGEVQEQRRLAYAMESDHLKIEAEFDAISTSTEPDYSAWIAKVEEIKARFPLPEENEV